MGAAALAVTYRNLWRIRRVLARANRLVDICEHGDGHFTEDGGCLCECPRCVGDWYILGGPSLAFLLEQMDPDSWLAKLPQKWLWHRPCICPGCSQDCTKIGRLERQGPMGAVHPPPPFERKAR